MISEYLWGFIIVGFFSLAGILLTHLLTKRHTKKAVERSELYAQGMKELEKRFEIHDLYTKIKDDCEIFLARKGANRYLTTRESAVFNAYILELQVISDDGLNGLQQMVDQVMRMEVKSFKPC